MKHVTVVDVDGKPMWEVPNWVLQDIAEALTELAARRLDKRKNHLRVVALVRSRFADPMENIKDVINRIVEDNPAPEGWEGENLPVAIAEQRGRDVLAFKKETQRIAPIPKPDLLTEDDLPKVGIKEALGDRNQFGIGDLIRKLHFVYPMAIDEADRATAAAPPDEEE